MVGQHRREPFINREAELERLTQLAEFIGIQPHSHAALIGLRRIGKSFLTREFIRRKRDEGALCVTMSCDTADDNASSWMYRMARAVLVAVDPALEDDLDMATPASLRPHLRTLPGDLDRRIESLFAEAERAKPSNIDLISGALLLPQRLAERAATKVVVGLDEFPSMLRLKRKSGLLSLEGVIREVVEEKSPDVLFVLTGSAVRKMRDVLEGDVPLLTRVHRINVGAFERAKAEELIDTFCGFLGYTIEPKARDDVLEFAGDNPFYITTVVKRAKSLAGATSSHIATSHVHEAFHLELVDDNGDIAVACRWIYEKSLSERAGEEDRRLLRELSIFQGPALMADLATALEWDTTKISRHVGMLTRAGVVRTTGDAKERLVSFADSVFATWVERESGHVGVSIEDTIGTLRKRLHRKGTEAGPWYEAYVKTVMENFRGQRWAGTTFGPAAPTTVQLPEFKDLEMNPAGHDATGELRDGVPGPVECDVHAIDGECWLVQIKSEDTKASKADLEYLEKQAAWFRKHQARRIDRLWFVALRGFNPEAERYAADNGIYITTGPQLKLLWLELQKRDKARRAKAVLNP